MDKLARARTLLRPPKSVGDDISVRGDPATFQGDTRLTEHCRPTESSIDEFSHKPSVYEVSPARCVPCRTGLAARHGAASCRSSERYSAASGEHGSGGTRLPHCMLI